MLDEPRLLAANAWVTRRPITVSEHHRMGEVGILGERDRIELIEGGERARVSVQNPVRLDDFNEPGPDFALLKPRPDSYRDAHPRPADVLVLIEVADTSLNYDRAVKPALYARHAIPEFWIIDLTSGEVEVCLDPQPDGYGTLKRVGRDGVLEAALLPGVRIPLATLFR